MHNIDLETKKQHWLINKPPGNLQIVRETLLLEQITLVIQTPDKSVILGFISLYITGNFCFSNFLSLDSDWFLLL